MKDHSPHPDIDATARAWRRFRLGSHGGDISRYAPPVVCDALRAKFAER